MMNPNKTRMFLGSLSLAMVFALSACQSNKVVVVDAKTGKPVSGASVYKVSGNTSSARHITDQSGVTPTPQLPGASRWTAVISKPGYQTVRF
jgi:hypothetical protein